MDCHMKCGARKWEDTNPENNGMSETNKSSPDILQRNISYSIHLCEKKNNFTAVETDSSQQKKQMKDIQLINQRYSMY